MSVSVKVYMCVSRLVCLCTSYTNDVHTVACFHACLSNTEVPRCARSASEPLQKPASLHHHRRVTAKAQRTSVLCAAAPTRKQPRSFRYFPHFSAVALSASSALASRQESSGVHIIVNRTAHWPQCNSCNYALYLLKIASGRETIACTALCRLNSARPPETGERSREVI